MEQYSNAPDKRVSFRAQRQSIEDIWRSERQWLNPVSPRAIEVPVPVEESEEAFREVDMGDIDESSPESGISKRQFIVIVVFLMVLAAAGAYMVTFVDIKTLPQNIIKRLY